MGKLQAAIVQVTSFMQNCTLLFDDETRKGVVIDPGGDVDRICDFIEENKIDVQAIWLTHGHIDHVGGAAELKEKLSVDIIGPHKDDKLLMLGVEEQAKMFQFTQSVRNVTPDRWLDEGDEVSFGDHKFDVYHCPGHAPGHVVFYNETAKFAQVGDVIFNQSIGRTDLPGGNHENLLASIKNKILPLGDDVQFICGHGPASNIGQERRSNPFLRGL